jgi:hypothetical protein
MNVLGCWLIWVVVMNGVFELEDDDFLIIEENENNNK